MTTTFPWATGEKLRADALNEMFHFGGNGSDGALSVSSGTTDIDLGGEAVVVKNYASISITGTAKITFSNPNASGTLVIFKCQGACTITSSATPGVDLRGVGAQGGAGGSGGSNGGAGSAGSDGNNGLLISDDNNHYGTGGGAGQESASGSGGSAGAVYSNLFLYARNASAAARLARIGIHLACGSGGGGGGGGDSDQVSGATAGDGGAGGDGGGALLIQCWGDLNITAQFNVSGNDGSPATRPSNTGENLGGAGGGGGGASGMVAVIYQGALVTNTATVSAVGGAGGAGNYGKTGGATSHSGAGGGGAGSYSGAGGAGGAGSDGAGSAGSAAGSNGAGGGGGGGSNDGSTQASGGSAGSSDSGALTVIKNRELG